MKRCRVDAPGAGSPFSEARRRRAQTRAAVARAAGGPARLLASTSCARAHPLRSASPASARSAFVLSKYLQIPDVSAGRPLFFPSRDAHEQPPRSHETTRSARGPPKDGAAAGRGAPATTRRCQAAAAAGWPEAGARDGAEAAAQETRSVQVFPAGVFQAAPPLTRARPLSSAETHRAPPLHPPDASPQGTARPAPPGCSSRRPSSPPPLGCSDRQDERQRALGCDRGSQRSASPRRARPSSPRCRACRGSRPRCPSWRTRGTRASSCGARTARACTLA
jgi:hypothetical protein